MDMRRTKIICTLGPASSSEAVMKELLLSGMNVARLNFSHGTHESHADMIRRFRSVRDELGLPAAVMLDTKGPEIRLGNFDDPAEVVSGQSYTFTVGEEITGDSNKCYVNYPGLPKDVKPGDSLLVDDGELSFRVDEVDGTEVRCTVVDGGKMRNHKGVNIPGARLTMPFLSDRDKSDLLFGIEQDVDYVAASFVRRGQDVADMRAFLDENGGERIRIIAKIENTEGVENFDEILALADGIMVARGDMGVEIPFERLPGIQKHFIRSCCQAGKTVITATQMLDSMEENRRPTRAEISDVANAVFDGSSAVMLSGESAAGKYPMDAVKTMARIVEQAEADAMKAEIYKNLWHIRDLKDLTNAVSAAACTMAEQTGARAILADTSTGKAARRLSKFRPAQQILAVTPSRKVYHQLSMVWGVTPLCLRRVDSVDVLFHCAIEKACSLGYLSEGDTVVLTAGIPLNTPGSTNMVKVQTVDLEED